MLRGDFFTLYDAELISLERIFKELNIEDTPGSYVDFLFEHFNKAAAYPDVEPTLTGLGGCMTGIVSNADVENIEGALKFNQLEFQVVITSESARRYKPDPFIFGEALNLLDCKPEEVLYVGDSQRDDIIGDRRAGIRVAWLNRRGETLKEGIPKPDYEIETLTELLKIIR